MNYGSSGRACSERRWGRGIWCLQKEESSKACGILEAGSFGHWVWHLSDLAFVMTDSLVATSLVLVDGGVFQTWTKAECLLNWRELVNFYFQWRLEVFFVTIFSWKLSVLGWGTTTPIGWDVESFNVWGQGCSWMDPWAWSGQQTETAVLLLWLHYFGYHVVQLPFM